MTATQLTIARNTVLLYAMRSTVQNLWILVDILGSRWLFCLEAGLICKEIPVSSESQEIDVAINIVAYKGDDFITTAIGYVSENGGGKWDRKVARWEVVSGDSHVSCTLLLGYDELEKEKATDFFLYDGGRWYVDQDIENLCGVWIRL